MIEMRDFDKAVHSHMISNYMKMKITTQNFWCNSDAKKILNSCDFLEQKSNILNAIFSFAMCFQSLWNMIQSMHKVLVQILFDPQFWSWQHELWVQRRKVLVTKEKTGKGVIF